MDSAWSLSYNGYNPEQEGLRETLCALGNGYFCSRGAAPDASADEVHYPGTYLVGGYNRLTTEINGERAGVRGGLTTPPYQLRTTTHHLPSFPRSNVVTIVKNQILLEIIR